MRKLLTVTLAFALLFSIAGCKKQPSANNTTNNQQNPTQQDPIQETAPEVTLPQENIVVEQKPMYAVSFAPQTKEAKDDTGKVRFRYFYQNISLILPETGVADRIILDYLSRMDQTAQYAESLLTESMLEEYDNMNSPFMYYVKYTPKRFDTTILSMHENAMIQSGGIHPNTYGHFTTYDLLSGKSLKLSDILSEGITAEALADTVISSLSDTEGFWPDYKETIHGLFEIGPEKYELWYFSETGLCFHFDPYILASYSAGPITAEIPYSELTGILRDEFFPAEKDSYSGSLVAEKFTVDTQENFTQYAEVVLAENGTKVLLSADGAITDITIKAETAASDSTVMAVQSLTPGDAIMVEFAPGAKLFISYRSGNQHETKTLTYSEDKIHVS